MSDEEMKFGLEGIEQSQGYEPMPMANPAPSSDDLASADAMMTEHELAHASRPAESDWGHAVERDYFDNQTGAETPKNQTVSADQAAHDLTSARAAERAERERQAQDDLRFALDQFGEPPAEQPQQPAQDQQIDQPQPEADYDAAHAESEARFAEADKAIEAMLAEPYVRERIEQSFNQVRQEASARAEQASRMAEAVQQRYAQTTAKLVQDASGIIGAVFPELQGLTGEQMQGALRVMAQQNPQRAQAFQQLTSRAQSLVEAHQRQQHEANMGLALKQEYEMKQYAEAETKKFEDAVKYESPETMKAVRENVYPFAEKFYGVPKQTLQALYSGERQLGSAALMRSAAFQLMVKDAISYRLAQQNITQARHAAVPNVQRPGVATGAPTQESDYASLERSLRGQTLNPKQAAALLTAHRARR